MIIYMPLLMINISKYFGNLLKSIVKIKMMEKQITLIDRFYILLLFLQSTEAGVQKCSIISPNSKANTCGGVSFLIKLMAICLSHI